MRLPLILLLAVTALDAQQPPPAPRPSYTPAPAPTPVIHVDGNCRIFVEDRDHPGENFSRPHFRTDRLLCHLEGVAHSKHWEYLPADGVIKRTQVSIVEQEYVFQDPFPYTVDFIVDQLLPTGWRVDSDPPPAEVNGNTITFHVFVKPGQVVKLHVGERH